MAKGTPSHEAAKSEGYIAGLQAAMDVIRHEDIVRGFKKIRKMIEEEQRAAR